jgi:hypothetical protein
MRYLFLPALICTLSVTTVGVAQPYYPRYYPPARRYSLNGADRLVRYWYKSYLRRPADPEERGSMADLLRAGRRPAAVLARLLASREYLDYAGGTRPAFIKQLILDVGHHEPGPREIRYNLYRTRNQRRGSIAYSFLLRYPQNWRPGLPAYPPDDFEED